MDEDSDAVFTCEINYADEEAQWLLNDKVLFTNEVNTITHDGKVHKLTLKNLAPKDGGTITFQVRKVKESVALKVKGNAFFNFYDIKKFLLENIYKFVSEHTKYFLEVQNVVTNRGILKDLNLNPL